MVMGSITGVYGVLTGWLLRGEELVKGGYIVYGLYRLWLVMSLAYF